MKALAQHELDASGLFCPEPVMMLHNTMRAAAPGERVLVIATDPSTERDIPKFCQFLGHALEAQAVEGDQYVYLLVKAAT
ncbi:sulfurtransferase TusA [Simiduia sp. 21SJ11W-1]|uniref:sulfurtransferase TusA n=1 Tax=Simiduia sp. 21SJ11W-1 TaxID=2909669 RepID=UPI00209E1725|nr:sulfurtransferase TusA [Simiduia sp. 21SJ11W-1]UTA49663.1 sulfurtransferase TusA [Simiduia sp. 21SJ11W-1]